MDHFGFSNEVVYPYNGITLRAQRHTFVPRRPGFQVPPFSQAQHGRLRYLTEDAFGSFLLRDCTIEEVGRLDIKKLKWRWPDPLSDDSAEFWVTAGLDDVVDGMQVMADRPAAGPKAAAAPKPGQPFDIMSDLQRVAAAEAKQKHKQSCLHGEVSLLVIMDEIDEAQEAMADLLSLDAHGPELAELLEQERREADARIQEQYDEEGQEHVDGIGDEDGREHGEAEVDVDYVSRQELRSRNDRLCKTQNRKLAAAKVRDTLPTWAPACRRRDALGLATIVSTSLCSARGRYGVEESES